MTDAVTVGKSAVPCVGVRVQDSSLVALDFIWIAASSHLVGTHEKVAPEHGGNDQTIVNLAHEVAMPTGVVKCVTTRVVSSRGVARA